MRLQLRSLVAAVALLFAASPFARAVDLLYVTLGNNTIVTYDTTGNVGATILATQVTFASTNLSSPQGLAFDSSGNLYAANNTGNTISKFDSAGIFKSSISSNLSSPRGLAFDSSGNLYAANSTGNTISKFDSADIFKSSISSNLSAPQGLAFDSSGNLYAANNGNSTISKFDSSGNFLTSWSTGVAPAFIAFQPVSVPEPSTYALAAIATGVMAAIARRRKARKA